ncbi:MAG: hypothetical protein ACQETH_13525 [Candidatus Rifleibacteriota bacterium]
MELKTQLLSKNRNNRLRFALGVLMLFVALGVWLHFYNFSPETYTGEIYMEPASKRSKEYLAFKLHKKNKTQTFMVLVKDLNFYSTIESFRNSKVKVKAFLHFHEPEDFNKIEIVEINSVKH